MLDLMKSLGLRLSHDFDYGVGTEYAITVPFKRIKLILKEGAELGSDGSDCWR
jgi:hypothetical protein